MTDKLTKPLNWLIIKYLQAKGNGTTTDIAIALRRTLPSVMPNLTELINKGYLKKENCGGRLIRYSLTELGMNANFEADYAKLKVKLFHITKEQYEEIKEIMKLEVTDDEKLYWINLKVFGYS